MLRKEYCAGICFSVMEIAEERSYRDVDFRRVGSFQFDNTSKSESGCQPFKRIVHHLQSFTHPHVTQNVHIH